MLRNIIKTQTNVTKLTDCLSKCKSRLYCKSTSLDNHYFKVYKPRRACMYIPGDNERKLAKIPQIKADCIILDCEDGVAVNRKVILIINPCKIELYSIVN